MTKLLRKTLRAVLNHDPSFCDMYADEASRRKSEEYLAHIRRHLAERFGSRPLSILDAGCQAGRLLIPLAQDGHRLIGIDTSGFALRRARRHAEERGLTVELHRGTIAHVRRWVKPESLDVVLCTEVLYLCQDYRELLRRLADSIKPGGLLCASHRPPQYYACAALRRGQPEQALEPFERSEGPSPDGAYHNWQTEPQLRELYRACGLDMVACYPVDHATLPVDLPALDGALRQRLEPLRQPDATLRVPSYWLVIARKPDGQAA